MGEQALIGRRMAVFVDAAYLLSAGGWATTGSWKRGDSSAKLPALVSWIQTEASREFPNHELLRVYWYDGAERREPEREQREVARQPDTKLRLGSINSYGQQKGVDALLLADMMDLASSHTVDTGILLSGDEDMLEVVKRVQAQGVRLILWGIDTPRNTVSIELRYEADRVRMLTAEELRPFFSSTVDRVGAAEAVSPASDGVAVDRSPPSRPRWRELELKGTGGDEPGVTIGGMGPPVTYADVDPGAAAESARAFVQDLVSGGQDLATWSVDRPQIPSHIDSKLLRWVCRQLRVPPEDQLDFDIRVAIRNAFWAEVDRQAQIGRDRSGLSESQ